MNLCYGSPGLRLTNIIVKLHISAPNLFIYQEKINKWNQTPICIFLYSYIFDWTNDNILQDPEVAVALQDVSMNPANFVKYQNNPKIAAVIEKLQAKLGKSGTSFTDFPGMFIPVSDFMTF